MITQKADPSDPLLGFTMGWIKGLAARLDHLTVICQERASALDLPSNVTLYSMGKEKSAGRITQAWRLICLLQKLTPQVDGIFCHMIPRYVLFAAPWRKPILLWYTHQKASLELKIAARLATRIATASPDSFPLKLSKVQVLGHGIDVERFHPLDVPENDPPEIALVARLSAIKNHPQLIEAAPSGAKLVFIGGGVPSELDYPATLARLAVERGVDLEITGALTPNQVIERLAHCIIAVNLSPPGLFDKAALESMLMGKITLVSNPDFAPLLEGYPLLVKNDLKTRLQEVLALSHDERRQIGLFLRQRTMAQHSLNGLMDRLVEVMKSL